MFSFKIESIFDENEEILEETFKGYKYDSGTMLKWKQNKIPKLKNILKQSKYAQIFERRKNNNDIMKKIRVTEVNILGLEQDNIETDSQILAITSELRDAKENHFRQHIHQKHVRDKLSDLQKQHEDIIIGITDKLCKIKKIVQTEQPQTKWKRIEKFFKHGPSKKEVRNEKIQQLFDNISISCEETLACIDHLNVWESNLI